jgi:hypothetical protein
MSPTRPEPRTERSAERLLLTTIALAFLVLGSIMGVIYLALWSSASEDLSRLLPASTRTYGQASNPLTGLSRSMTLDGWRDPTALQKAIVNAGLFTSPSSSLADVTSPGLGPSPEPPRGLDGRPCVACGDNEIAGLPADIVRDLLRNMDGLEVALVPVADTSALMVFIELRDPSQRKRLLSRIRPHLETVDREVGFRIDRFRPRPWTNLTGQEVEPPRFVDMEPWFILHWGAPQALDDLLGARVGGRYDAIHRRPGFVGPASASAEADLIRVVVDARSAWQILSGDEPLRPGGLLEYLDLLTLTSQMSGDHDLFELRAEISDRDLAQTLDSSFTNGDHDLLALAPSDATIALSATGDDLPALLEAARSLAFRITRDFGPTSIVPPELPALDDTLAPPPRTLTEFAAVLAASASDLPTEPAEVAAFLLPTGPSPAVTELVIVIRTSSPNALENALASAIPRRLGDGHSHGEVTHRGSRLYVERPVGDGEGFVWRVRDGSIELAADVSTLDRFADTSHTLGSSGLLSRSMEGLPTESAIKVFMRADTLRTFGAATALVASRLTDEFTFGATLETVGDRLVLRSNLGLWSLGAAIASATSTELDDLTLTRLPPECRAAYDAFCTAYPAASPCRPYALGRVRRILAVCADLGRAP